MLKRPQRGLSLLAFVFWLAWAGICLYASILFIPVLNEYGAVQRAVRKIATSGATTRFEVQSANLSVARISRSPRKATNW
jgi:hypothetical protein